MKCDELESFTAETFGDGKCEVLGYRFSEFQCRSCRTEECLEQACLVGLSFSGCEFKIRRKKK